jgi:hypothetical protein
LLTFATTEPKWLKEPATSYRGLVEGAGTMTGRILVIACGFACSVLGDTEYKLGGPRKVVARIVETESDFRITVQMAPVRCFDSALNKKVNREKARAFALVALAKRCNAEKARDSRVTVRGGEIIDSRLDKDRFVLTWRVPRNGVERALPTKKPKAGKSPTAFHAGPSTSLLTAKEDCVTTLQLLTDALAADIPQVPKSKNGNEAFLRAVADAEERGVDAFKQILGDIEANNLLLAYERDELLLAVQDSEKGYLKRLADSVKSLAASDHD